jgi:hypothetical protein
MAYDARREVTVMFGSGNGDRKTWEFDGERWASRTTPNSPSARSEHGMAYDEDRNVVVLFGGRDSSGDLDDTWEYDGNDWTLKSPAATPGPSRKPGMTYDTLRRRILVVRGGETWEWDGADWTQKDSSSPTGPGLAFDSARGVAVLAQSSRSFEWDGSSWTEVAGLPISPREPSLTYDPVRAEILLFGGRGGLGGSNDFGYGTLLAYDGNEWRTLPGGPAGRYRTAFVFDTTRNIAVLFGGTARLGNFVTLNNIWTWDGSEWDRPLFANPDPTFDMSEKPDGIWNYTTVDVPTGVELSFKKNAANNPVVWLASGDVSIAGTINLDGARGAGVAPGDEAPGGPGGYAGGLGGVRFDQSGSYAAKPGDGPGGGLPGTTSDETGGTAGYGTAGSGERGGIIYGSIFIEPLVGGSGGGGRGSRDAQNGASGGGGGGAILIASSGTIRVNGAIHADGGAPTAGSAGHGSGGGIRLVANRIEGGGTLRAHGRTASDGAGRIRTEAFFLQLTSVPQPVNSAAPPSALALGDTGDIRITNVAGLPVAQPPSGSLNTPDVVFSQAGEITVAMATTNVPPGTVLTVRITAAGEVITAQSTPTDAGGNATAQATVPAGLGTIQAFAEFAAAP